MSKIWEFFEELNELVYVSDIDTYDIVYMNKKALNAFGLKALRDAEGKKCYEVIQGSGKKCTVCTNPLLCEGKFFEWRYFNPITGTMYALKDTLIKDGSKRYRLEIALNTAQSEPSCSGRENHSMEKLVNEAIRLALKAPTPDHTINVFLEYIGKILKADRTYIFEQNKRGNDDNTYEWTAAGITPEINNLQDVPAAVCADWYKNFSIDKNIVITDVNNLKATNPSQYEILTAQNIHSLVVVPLYNNSNNVIGFYGVDNPPADDLVYITDMLQIMGHFIVSSITRRNLLRELYVMSHHDQMTGFGNRYAMNEYVKQASADEGIGMVYFDITGLKRVNDLLGHDEGDRLILRACRCITDIFGEYGCFRIGGDELLAVCKGISRQELDDKVKAIRSVMHEYSVNMAVGHVWQERGRLDLDALLSSSESLMRSDKEDYYRRSGIERRQQ